jgi:multiple sugar transport system permease protein
MRSRTDLQTRRGRGRLGLIVGQAAIHLVLIAASLAAFLPFVWMALASFKEYKELVSSRALLPVVWSLKNYTEILSRVGFPVAFKNSILIAVPTTLAVMLTSAAVGYVFAKYPLWKKELWFVLILGTMMVPFTVIVIPLYVTMAEIHMVNSMQGIIVVGLWSTFGIFMMRQSIETIPNDYIDAARIDGAGELWVFLRLVCPLSTAALSSLGVLTFLGSWDNFAFPSIMLKRPAIQTLPILLAGMRNLWVMRYDLWVAGAMLTVVPVMLLFTIAQRTFVRGLSMSGLK